MSVLVMGSSGMVGSQLVKALPDDLTVVANDISTYPGMGAGDGFESRQQV